MAWPFFTANDVQLGSVESGEGFWLKVNGYDDTYCRYAATQGYAGFGKTKRRVTYPAGKIVLEIAPGRTIDCASLDDAKAKLALVLNAS